MSAGVVKATRITGTGSRFMVPYKPANKLDQAKTVPTSRRLCKLQSGRMLKTARVGWWDAKLIEGKSGRIEEVFYWYLDSKMVTGAYWIRQRGQNSTSWTLQTEVDTLRTPANSEQPNEAVYMIYGIPSISVLWRYPATQASLQREQGSLQNNFHDPNTDVSPAILRLLTDHSRNTVKSPRNTEESQDHVEGPEARARVGVQDLNSVSGLSARRSDRRKVAGVIR